MGIFLRKLWQNKPKQYGPWKFVHVSLMENAEKLGIDPQAIVAAVPMWNPRDQHDYSKNALVGPNDGTISYSNNGLFFPGNKVLAMGTIEVQEHTMLTSIDPVLNQKTMLGGICDNVTASGVEWALETNGRVEYAYNDGSIQGWYDGRVGMAPAGVWSNVGVRWRQSEGKVDFFSDKVAPISANTTTGTIVYDSDTFDIGHASVNDEYLGSMSYFLLFSSLLTDTQITLLFDNPWQLWQPRTPVFYSIPSEGSTLLPIVLNDAVSSFSGKTGSSGGINIAGESAKLSNAGKDGQVGGATFDLDSIIQNYQSQNGEVGNADFDLSDTSQTYQAQNGNIGSLSTEFSVIVRLLSLDEIIIFTGNINQNLENNVFDSIGQLGNLGVVAIDTEAIDFFVLGLKGSFGIIDTSVSCGVELLAKIGLSGVIGITLDDSDVKLIEVVTSKKIYHILLSTKTGNITILTPKTGSIDILPPKTGNVTIQ